MVKCQECLLNLSGFEIPSLGVVFLGFQIFMILSKDKKISVIYFLNASICFDFVMHTDIFLIYQFR